MATVARDALEQVKELFAIHNPSLFQFTRGLAYESSCEYGGIELPYAHC
jgi:hypothetical protein